MKTYIINPHPTEQELAANRREAAPELLAACKLAKKYLEPDLVEPGRTVFWNLVAAIRKAEGELIRSELCIAGKHNECGWSQCVCTCHSQRPAVHA